jgi:hypothetical protein
MVDGAGGDAASGTSGVGRANGAIEYSIQREISGSWNPGKRLASLSETR